MLSRERWTCSKDYTNYPIKQIACMWAYTFRNKKKTHWFDRSLPNGEWSWTYTRRSFFHIHIFHAFSMRSFRKFLSPKLVRVFVKTSSVIGWFIYGKSYRKNLLIAHWWIYPSPTSMFNTNKGFVTNQIWLIAPSRSDELKYPSSNIPTSSQRI